MGFGRRSLFSFSFNLFFWSLEGSDFSNRLFFLGIFEGSGDFLSLAIDSVVEGTFLGPVNGALRFFHCFFNFGRSDGEGSFFFVTVDFVSNRSFFGPVEGELGFLVGFFHFGRLEGCEIFLFTPLVLGAAIFFFG